MSCYSPAPVFIYKPSLTRSPPFGLLGCCCACLFFSVGHVLLTLMHCWTLLCVLLCVSGEALYCEDKFKNKIDWFLINLHRPLNESMLWSSDDYIKKKAECSIFILFRKTNKQDKLSCIFYHLGELKASNIWIHKCAAWLYRFMKNIWIAAVAATDCGSCSKGLGDHCSR